MADEATGGTGFHHYAPPGCGRVRPPSMIVVLGSCLAAVVVGMVVLWAVSVRLSDASIVDIAWGMAFVLITWVGFAIGDKSTGRSVLLAIMVSVWGVRLSTYLARRNLGHGEDARYAAMRRTHQHFARWSLYGVFGTQALLAWVVSLPVQLAMADRTPPGIGLLGWIGLAVWCVGLGFESVGDFQLARFKRDPSSAGQVMDRGLWRFTRHPNYFGDFLVWWGLFLVAVETGSAAFGVVGPVVMTVLLTKVSGKDLLERSIGKRRPGYADYVARTSGFVPLPPKRR
jgi:steroid 5-alpha reductase family enzyme